MNTLIISNSANSLWYFRRTHVKSIHASVDKLTILTVNDITDSSRIDYLKNNCSNLILVRNNYQLFLKSILLISKADIILSYSILAGVMGGFFGFIFNVKNRVVLFSGLGYLNYSLKTTILSRIITLLLKFNNRAIFVNNEDQHVLSDRYGLHFSDSLTILGEGMDIVPIINEKSENKIAMYAGRLHPQKCINLLIDAFSRQNYLEELLLVGFTEKELLDYYGRSFDLSKVKCLGRVDDIYQYLVKAKYAIMPSLPGEGFPTYLMEAMLNKRIMISTDTAGNKEALDNGKNGILIEHDYFRNKSSDYVSAVACFAQKVEQTGLLTKEEEENYTNNAYNFLVSNCERNDIANQIKNYITQI